MTDWEGILSRDGPAVWRCAYRLLGRREEAEDCFQETFLAALEAWPRLTRGGRSIASERAVLLRLATVRAMDRLRARYRRAARERPASTVGATSNGEALDWHAVASAEPSPVQQAEAAELSARLRAALATLPPRQADVFCLHCLEGWSYTEIAEELEVTVDSVGVLLHRARAKLRVLLASAATVEQRSGR